MDVNSDDDGSSSDGSTNIQKHTRSLVTALDTLKTEETNGHPGRCDFCNRRSHTEPTCFFNPDNPNNRLPPKMKERMMVTDNNESKKKPSLGGRLKGERTKLEVVGMVQ